MAKKSRSTSGGENKNFSEFPNELIVLAKADAALRAWGEDVSSTSGEDVSPLKSLLDGKKCSMVPLFGMREDKLRDQIASFGTGSEEMVSEMSRFYHITAEDASLDDLCEEFNKLDIVEAAYVKPPVELASAEQLLDINTMTSDGPESVAASPNYLSNQRYLNPAPDGIDAKYAWTLPGGRGKGVSVVDCEWGWNFTHEDLKVNSLGVVVGTNSTVTRFVNHGTAVIGEIGGDQNSFGVTGICPDARVGGASFVGKPTALTIREAADKLKAGDILLLEVQRAGPRFNFQGRQDQRGYIAIEWWPDDFAAIRYAIKKGIIVVEAAGNGGENFDDAIYNNRPAGFPASWRNPFNPANPSSEAVMVGAGAPPPGTHGRSHGPDRSRLGFSNYGKRVDCQGYGREVTSTGYGDLQSGPTANEWYTDRFSGTSSASPIVVGALGCVQGILRHQGKPLLTSARAIKLLRSTGTPQTNAPGRPSSQRIGNRPNLKQLIPAATNGWSTNRKVIRLFSHPNSKYAWVQLAGGSGWIRIRPNSADGVTDVLMSLGNALTESRPVDVFISNNQITLAVLK